MTPTHMMKPVMIEAYQVSDPTASEQGNTEFFWIAEWSSATHAVSAVEGPVLLVTDENGDQDKARAGDWIAKDKGGGFYVVPGELFPEMFDAVD